jgi:hypothetical protein
MENLLENDSTFELFTSSNDGNLFRNRVLTTMPSEKSSFQVYLGFQGEEDDKKTDKDAEKDKPKREYDPEKIAQGVSATASAVSSIGSTVQAFKGDGTKPKSKRKQLKDVCGRKPLLKKKREGEYNKCVADYNAGKIGMENTNRTSDDTPPPPPPPPPKDYNKIIIGSVVVVAVLVTAFIGYKKGWFGAKA